MSATYGYAAILIAVMSNSPRVARSFPEERLLRLDQEESPMYPEPMVKPMREELTRLGIQELRTAAELLVALDAARFSPHREAPDPDEIRNAIESLSRV